jgi:C4-dicarboxylate-specific signal transduction histidine kinase
MTPVPLHLQGRLNAFVAEEVMASMRHSVVNDLTALAALCYRLKVEHLVKLSDAATSTSAHDLIDSIQGYVGTASRRLAVTFLPEPGPRPRPLEVNTILKSLARAMTPPSGIALKGPSSESLLLRIDQVELELAVACLLANAYDAVAASGGPVQLRCNRGPGETIHIEVTHEGAPLGAKALMRVFDPFFSTKPGHLGLGLNIARRIAARWGGTLELTTGDHRGVVSTLSLPLSPSLAGEA